ncbi:Nickel pincer cofactor biosynthesis protein LarC [Tumidithrix helvetica PCC 7403]|uniref:LarC family nickel insertion protein n=1 Tax=Tumidithrix helvetica TaxID=3457545 RepID=UPI003C8651E7
MSNIAYWDCHAGIAGDMCLGALVSAGVPIDYLNLVIDRLGLSQKVKIRSELVLRCGQEATKVHVELIPDDSMNPDREALPEESAPPEPDHSHDRAHEHTHKHSSDHDHEHTHDRSQDRDTSHDVHTHHRHLPEIETLIRQANLPLKVEFWSLRIFRCLAIAEGKVHGIAPEQVHFHEVGALDAIVDIVCTCAGLDWLGIDQLFCSALPTGGGFVKCEHGRMPVPAPAVLKLWELHQVPVFSNGIEKELVTPTGAAIAVSLCESFGKSPNLRIKKVGLGAGTRDLEIPNIVRLWIGEGEDSLSDVQERGEKHKDKKHKHKQDKKKS